MAPSAVYQAASSLRASNAKGKGKGKRTAEDAEMDAGDEAAQLVVVARSDEEASDDDEAGDDEEDEDVDDDDDDEGAAEASSRKLAKLERSEGNLLQPKGATAARTTFKQKTLILSSRGITHRMRHMMKDLASLLPHSKTDAKLDTKHQLGLLNELADLSNCSSALFFEARRHSDLYMWASMTPNGPSVRFHLLNAHTMDELKMTGNCLKGSRPIVVFDKTFDESPQWRLIKEVLMQTFAAPKTARRAKPFIDHVTSFSVADNKIWFRNYQIVHDAPLDLSAGAEDDESTKAVKAKLSKQAEENMSMNEIGPRFVLVPVKIFEGSFGGAVVWENKEFMAPQAKLAAAKMAKAVEYKGRKGAENDRKNRKEYLDAQEQDDRVTSGRAALAKSKVFA